MACNLFLVTLLIVTKLVIKALCFRVERLNYLRIITSQNVRGTFEVSHFLILLSYKRGLSIRWNKSCLDFILHNHLIINILSSSTLSRYRQSSLLVQARKVANTYNNYVHIIWKVETWYPTGYRFAPWPPIA